MLIFAAVAETGSFTLAAEKIGLSKSMVSQHISRLEEGLGVKLMNRSTRNLALTEAGSRFLAGCGRVLDAAQETIREMEAAQVDLTGRLRVTAPSDFSSRFLIPVISRFRETEPSVSIKLIVDDAKLDLIAERFDLAVRVGWLENDDYCALRLTSFDEALCAAPAYLAERGVPERPGDLAQHDWVGIAQPSFRPVICLTHPSGRTERVKLNPVVESNAVTAVRDFLCLGAGIGRVPEYFVREMLDSGELMQLLPEYGLRPGGVFAVYPYQKFTPKRLRVFVDFLKSEVSGAGVDLFD